MPASELQLPAAKQSEYNVLGSIFLARDDALMLVCDFLKPEHFYQHKAAKVYRTMLTLFQRGEPIDTVSVTNELERSNGALEVPDLADYLDATDTAYHVIHHAREVVRMANCRKAMQLGSRMVSAFQAGPANVESAIGQFAQDMLGIVDRTKRNSPSPRDILEELRARDNSKVAYTEMGTLNRYTSGIRPTHLWAIGGFSSTGKTAFALQLLLELAKQGRRLAYFSLEMARHELMLRLLANVSGQCIYDIDHGRLSEDQRYEVNKAEQWLIDREGSLWFYDDVYELAEMGYLCRRHKLKDGLDAVFVDFIQNLQGPGDEYERLSHAAKSLQQLAKQLDCTIFVLSQISNEQASAGMGTSQSYSFKGTGAIRDAADKAIMLTRDRKADMGNDVGTLTAKVMKNRQGPIGEVRLNFEFATGRISEAH